MTIISLLVHLQQFLKRSLKPQNDIHLQFFFYLWLDILKSKVSKYKHKSPFLLKIRTSFSLSKDTRRNFKFEKEAVLSISFYQ